MQPHEHEHLLRHYWQELTYLRKMGAVFARRYPKIAARLELELDQTPDPHVERLIESFAFLTARIQRDIESDFPEVATEMLALLHPHYLNPVPSMTVTRFEVDPERGKLTTGHEIPKHTGLFTHSGRGDICRFRTCYPVMLWPVAVVEAGFESPDQFDFLDSARVASVLRLRIGTLADPLHDLDLDRLRFYIHGDRLLVSLLYELIFARVLRVAALADTAKEPRYLPEECLRPVGFDLEEEVLPYPSYSQPAYRLVQEYFTFPQKFHFLDIDGLGGLGAELHFDLLFLLAKPPGGRLAVGPSTFMLGCTPAINLFPKTTEPIRIDQRTYEYQLVPDQRRERTTEVHSVFRVSGTSDFSDRTKEYLPFYSFDHQSEIGGQEIFWHTRRVPRIGPEAVGTDVLISFVDLSFDPRLPPSDSVYARTLCTNRQLAAQMPTGAPLQTEEVAPVGRIVCLVKPTEVLSPPMSGQNLWRLISHLSLNHLSLTGGEESLQALREILRLYSYSDSPSTHLQITGLRGLAHQNVVRRVGPDAWRGYCRGTEITLEFDEEHYVGTNAFLLGAVLNHFFALYSSTNHFTQLVIKSRQRRGEEWKRWPPMVGEKRLL